MKTSGRKRQDTARGRMRKVIDVAVLLRLCPCVRVLHLKSSAARERPVGHVCSRFDRTKTILRITWIWHLDQWNRRCSIWKGRNREKSKRNKCSLPVAFYFLEIISSSTKINKLYIKFLNVFRGWELHFKWSPSYSNRRFFYSNLRRGYSHYTWDRSSVESTRTLYTAWWDLKKPERKSVSRSRSSFQIHHTIDVYCRCWLDKNNRGGVTV